MRLPLGARGFTVGREVWWMQPGLAWWPRRCWRVRLVCVFYGVGQGDGWALGRCWHLACGPIEVQVVCDRGRLFNGLDIPAPVVWPRGRV